MNGVANQKRLLDAMEIPARLDTVASGSSIRREIQQGGPVIISTPLHYFTATDVDPETGALYVGTSGTDLKAGKAWMTLDEIERVAGRINGALYTELQDATLAPMEQPEGSGTMANTRTVSTQDALDTLAAEHGGIAGSRDVSKTKTDERTGNQVAVESALEFTFGDGSKITVKYPDDYQDTGRVETIAPLSGAPTQSTARGGPSSEFETWFDADGNPIKRYNPRTGQVVDLPDPRTGTVRTPEQTALDVARTGQAGASATSSFASAELSRLRGQLAAAKAPLERLEILERINRLQTQQGADLALATQRETSAAVEAQKLAPAIGLAIQNHYRTVEQVRGMVAAGQLEPSEAQAYIDSSREYLDAAMKGTTPFDRMKQEQEETRQRATLGKDVLNNRVTNTVSLAQSILSQIDPTKAIGVDYSKINPFAMSQQFVEETGGGPEVGAVAKGLMLGFDQYAPQGQVGQIRNAYERWRARQATPVEATVTPVQEEEAA